MKFFFILFLSINLWAYEYIITIDDGPNKYTERILNALVENNVKEAVFFITDIGVGQLAMYKSVLPKIIQANYTIGNHTFTHCNLSTHDNIWTYKFKELEPIHNYLYRELNYTITLFRPPYGRLNNIIIRSYQLMNYDLLGWDADISDDLIITSSANISSAIKRQLHEEGCNIILVHSTSAVANNISKVIKVLNNL